VVYTPGWREDERSPTVSEEKRNYGMEPDPEKAGFDGPRSEGSEADPSRLRRIHTNQTTDTSPKDERTWSVLAHLSVFLNLVTGFLGPVGALIIWLMYKEKSPRVSFHALQALWHQVAWIVILAAGWIVATLLTVVLIGFLLFPVMAILTVVPFIHMGYAAYKVSQGVDYRYPYIANMIEGNRTSGSL
jgi:uncharacterized protein